MSIFANFWYVQITIDLVFLVITTIPFDILHCSMLFMAEQSVSFSLLMELLEECKVESSA